MCRMLPLFTVLICGLQELRKKPQWSTKEFDFLAYQAQFPVRLSRAVKTAFNLQVSCTYCMSIYDRYEPFYSQELEKH